MRPVAPRGYSIDAGGEAVWDPALDDAPRLPATLTLELPNTTAMRTALTSLSASAGEEAEEHEGDDEARLATAFREVEAELDRVLALARGQR